MAPHPRNRPAAPERMRRLDGRDGSGICPGGTPNKRTGRVTVSVLGEALHQRVETSRHGEKMPVHPRMPSGTARNPRLFDCSCRIV